MVGKGVLVSCMTSLRKWSIRLTCRTVTNASSLDMNSARSPLPVLDRWPQLVCCCRAGMKIVDRSVSMAPSIPPPFASNTPKLTSCICFSLQKWYKHRKFRKESFVAIKKGDFAKQSLSYTVSPTSQWLALNRGILVIRPVHIRHSSCENTAQPLILRIALGGKPKWLPQNLGTVG